MTVLGTDPDAWRAAHIRTHAVRSVLPLMSHTLADRAFLTETSLYGKILEMPAYQYYPIGAFMRRRPAGTGLPKRTRSNGYSGRGHAGSGSRPGNTTGGSFAGCCIAPLVTDRAETASVPWKADWMGLQEAAGEELVHRRRISRDSEIARPRMQRAWKIC